MDASEIALVDGAYGVFEGPSDDAVVFGTYRREGTWSGGLVELLAGELLASGGTLVDVGANIGLCTVPVVERSGARALAFEPEPLCSSLLRANVARHGLAERVECFELALSDRNGRTGMTVNAHNRGDNRLLPRTSTECVTHVEVALARLDDLLADRKLSGPVVMKIDAQGAEVAILRGAQRTLSAVDHLVLEYWPLGIANQGDRAEELPTLLTSFTHGAVLNQDGDRPQLVTRQTLFQNLAWIPIDGSDAGFFDLWLTR